ncbi:hypothetical protein B0H17DRAFT_923764, partial [Mycena rosella]
LRLTNDSGLLWEVSQRQDIHPIIEKPQLPLHFAQDFPSPDEIFDQINHGVTKFCPSLNCVSPSCQIHSNSDFGQYTPVFTPKAPLLTSPQFFDQRGEPCGEDCFRHVDSDEMEADIFLSDFTFLDGMLKLDPDVLPCDLAMICKLPCLQIFLYRRQAISDAEVIRPARHLKPEPGSQDFCKLLICYLTELNPFISPACVHPGPCSARMECECVKRKVFCERNCRCNVSCVCFLDSILFRLNYV